MEFITWDLVSNFLIQIGTFLGIIFIFGFLIGLCHDIFYRNLRHFGKPVFYATALIGAPIHELSHALFCIIFRHRITSFNPFVLSSDPESPLWAHVGHSWNKRNLYQNVGNFFIGIAPILVMSALIFVMTHYLLPEFTQECIALIGSLDSFDFKQIWFVLSSMITGFFSYYYMPIWWLVFILTLMLSLHMSLSQADIKGSLSGIIFFVVALFILNVLLSKYSRNGLRVFTDFFISSSAMIFCILSFALMFALISVALSFVIGLFASKKRT